MPAPRLPRACSRWDGVGWALALLLAWAGVAVAQAPSGTRRPPFYFSVPASSLAPLPAVGEGGRLLSGEPLRFVPAREFEGREAGLRVIPLGAVSRRAAFARLEAAHLLAAGDIVLTFRPSWADTMAYPQVQMGASHAGLIYEEEGALYSLDMPLDGEYNLPALHTHLDSEHYATAEGFHILRPRNFDAAAKASLAAWVKVLRRNLEKIKATGHLRFNSDYLSPRYVAFRLSPEGSVCTFARILKQQPVEVGNFTMYCSEFAWHLLSLAQSGPPEHAPFEPAEIRPIFSPQNLLTTGRNPGLTEGPLFVLQELSSAVSVSRRTLLAASVFETRNAAALSSGHRDVSASTAPLLQAVRPYYLQRLAAEDDGALAERTASQINTQCVRNFSPTSFMVNSVLPLNHSERKLDYLYTVLFVSEGQLLDAERATP